MVVPLSRLPIKKVIVSTGCDTALKRHRDVNIILQLFNTLSRLIMCFILTSRQYFKSIPRHATTSLMSLEVKIIINISPFLRLVRRRIWTCNVIISIMYFYLDISTALQSNSTTRRDKFNESRGRNNNKWKSI